MRERVLASATKQSRERPVPAPAACPRPVPAAALYPGQDVTSKPVPEERIA